jgi:hypothetical protein
VNAVEKMRKYFIAVAKLYFLLLLWQQQIYCYNMTKEALGNFEKKLKDEMEI